MSKHKELNNLFTDFYSAKTKDSAILKAKKILKYLLENHSEHLDVELTKLTLEGFKNDFENYLSHFGKDSNPFYRDVDIIRGFLA